MREKATEGRVTSQFVARFDNGDIEYCRLTRRRLQRIDQLQCGEPPEILVGGARRRALLESYGSERRIADQGTGDLGLSHLLAE